MAIGTISTADPATPAVYRGRFAPSPSGPLHFGSLVAAVGSFLDARAHGGEWLVRLEDLDTPRVRAGAADAILSTLESLGMHWDGPVWRQSQRVDVYHAALDRLQAEQLLRSCSCSRSALAALRRPEAATDEADDELFHPADCLVAGPDHDAGPAALRFRVGADPVQFIDRSLGEQRCDVRATVGDFVLKRRDGIVAYQLAVVVDDAAQGVTDVIRGCDLLASTPRQISLQQALGLPQPRYLHLPLAVDDRGRKLSKSENAPALRDLAPVGQIFAVLAFLGQQPPSCLREASLAEIWTWAKANWQPIGFAGSRKGNTPQGSGA